MPETVGPRVIGDGFGGRETCKYVELKEVCVHGQGGEQAFDFGQGLRSMFALVVLHVLCLHGCCMLACVRFAWCLAHQPQWP